MHQNTKNSSGKWTICQYFVHNSIIIDIHGHRFEIYTLVSEIHENADLVLRVKNVFELEDVINSWNYCFNFLNRSLPIFPKDHTVLKPKEQKLIKVNVPFVDEISGLAIVKISDRVTHSTMLLKLKFMLDIAHNGTDTIILKPEMFGVLDLRSLGYYKIKHGILQQNLSNTTNSKKQILRVNILIDS